MRVGFTSEAFNVKTPTRKGKEQEDGTQVNDLLEKARLLEAEHNKRPAKRESNRARYPQIAEFVDGLREVFGEVRVMKITEKQP